MPDNKHTTTTETRAEEPVVQPAVEPVPEPYEDAQGVDLEKGNEKSTDLDLVHIQSHASAHDIPHIPYHETGDEVYDKFTHSKKIMIVSVLAFCSFLAPMASTTVLAAVPEVAATYNTTGTLINASDRIIHVVYGTVANVLGTHWSGLRKTMDSIAQRYSVRWIFHWYCTGSQPGVILHLPHLDGIPRHFLPHHR